MGNGSSGERVKELFAEMETFQNSLDFPYILLKLDELGTLLADPVNRKAFQVNR